MKTLTVSALTGGVLALAYAAWSKWRAAPEAPPVPAQRELDNEPVTQPRPANAASSDAVSIDVDLDGLWDSADSRRNPKEQLVDFSSDMLSEGDDDDGAVAPEGLGVRWLSRATEAMSPFHHELSVRDEAEAALLENAPPEEEDDYPESENPRRRGAPGELASKTRDE
jgi:hypothetical protein